MSKDIFKAMIDMGQAIDSVQKKWKELLKAEKTLAKAAEELKEITSATISKPQIEIEDCELDG